KTVLVFFGTYALAAALGADPWRSFFGTYERMLGVVNLAHFVALFFMVKSVFVSGRDWLMLLRVFLGASVLVSLYGIGQKLGMEWFYHANIDRIDSTIGNAAFVAGYLIFALFFALLLLVKDANMPFRIFYIFSIALNLAVIYFTGTRGAALALLAGFFVLLALYLFKRDISIAAKKNTFIIVLGVAVAVFIATFFFAGKEGFLQYFKRFTSVSLDDATVKTRIFSAQSSWRGFLERPMLGWGPENYNLVFDKYYNPKLYPIENWFDHAHNIIFDVITTMGVIGLAAYLFLVGNLARRGFAHARQDPREYWIGTLIWVLVLVYFLQNLFVFDSLVTYLPLMLVLAFAGAGFPLSEVAAQKQKDGKAKKFYNPSSNAAIFMLPVLVLTIYFVNVRPAFAAYYTVAALRGGAMSADEAITAFGKAIAYSNFGRHEIRGKLADATVDFLHNKDNSDEEGKKKLAVYTMREMEKSLKEAPLDFRNYLYFANFLSNAGEALAKSDIDAFKEADAALEKARELGPDKQILYIQWARIKFALSDYAGAVPLLEKLVALSPDIVDSNTKLAHAHAKTGARDKALAIYRALMEQNGLNVQNYIDIAIGFAEAGEKEGAVQAALKIKEIDPPLSEKADQFIASLK
ncbi:hypothetical protein A3C91_03835, partial [Candidatus Azambacteria bacterium RIFCSPHIGHO2_02_FULL_52_12]